MLAQIAGTEEETRYLLLDEPTNNLDLSHQRTVYRSVRRLAGRGVAVGMVVHDLNQALQVADRIVILDHGRIALEGTPECIAGSPECERIFGVSLKRVPIEGRPFPYLLFEIDPD